MQIIFATHNQNKLLEVQKMLPSHITALSLADLGFQEEIEETGDTLEANAFIKANTIFKKFNLPVFADDSGLEVDFLGGKPGVYSARYAGNNCTYDDNCIKMLGELQHTSNRSAAFRTVFCFIDAEQKIWYFDGTIHGDIASEQLGNNGFGYDSIFVPKGYNQTFAQMTSAEKNSISHRSIAFAKLLNHLKSLTL